MIKLMAKKNSGIVGKTAAKEETPAPSSTVVSEPFKSKKLQLPTGKRARIVFGLVGLIAVIAGVVVLVMQLQEDKTSAPVAATVTDAHAQVISGNFSAAEQSLQEALKKTDNPQEKASIELGIAEALVNDEKYDEAITHAQASNKYTETAGAHALIGFAAAQAEKWQVSADSYAKAAELSKGDDAVGTQYTYYKNKENEARTNL